MFIVLESTVVVVPLTVKLPESDKFPNCTLSEVPTDCPIATSPSVIVTPVPALNAARALAVV